MFVSGSGNVISSCHICDDGLDSKDNEENAKSEMKSEKVGRRKNFCAWRLGVLWLLVISRFFRTFVTNES